MSERDQPTIDAANELLRTTMTAAIYLPLADGKSAYLGGDSDIALMLADKYQSGAAVRGEAVADICAAVMNIPVTRTMSHFATQHEMRTYKEGHREALCAAIDVIAGFSARAADALDSQPTEPDGCAECRHTYCMSGEVCKACGDVAMQGWKGGRQPTDGGVRNG